MTNVSFNIILFLSLNLISFSLYVYCNDFFALFSKSVLLCVRHCLYIYMYMFIVATLTGIALTGLCSVILSGSTAGHNIPGPVGKGIGGIAGPAIEDDSATTSEDSSPPGIELAWWFGIDWLRLALRPPPDETADAAAAAAAAAAAHRLRCSNASFCNCCARVFRIAIRLPK